MNILRNTTALALSIVESYIEKGDTVIDATCGNGHDTLALSRMVGEEGKVYGFEIQPLAVMRAMNMLYKEEAPSEIEMIYHGHEMMDLFVEEEVKAVVFNLGYLPGGDDKEITTKKETTLIALQKAIDKISVDGIVSVTIYPGHEAGREEAEAVLKWAESLDKKVYHVAHISMINQPETAPQILDITKKVSTR